MGNTKSNSILGHIIRREVYFVLAAYVLLIAVFETARAVMLYRNYGLAEHLPVTLLLKSFFYGLRFDIAISSYLLIPLLLLLLFVPRRFSPHILAAFTAFFSALFFLCLGEVEFYRELQMRFNSAIFEYATHPEIVGGMVWEGYPVVKYALFWAVVMALFSFAVFVLYKKLLGSKTNIPELTRNHRIAGYAGTFVVITLMVFGMRGGFYKEPLRWGDAYFSDEAFANNLALNAVFTLGRSSLEKLSTKENYWTKTYSAKDAEKITHDMLIQTTETDLASAELPLLRKEGPETANAYLVKKPEKPVNVVIILMESFSGRLVGSLGDEHNITPSFDKLAKDGVLFERAFSNGSHTHQGVFASLTSFPNLPGHEYLMKTMDAYQEFSGLPTILTSKGYDSIFLYNGLFSWDNKEGFFRQHGINKFVGTDDYVNPTFVDPVWGVADYDVFMRANEEFKNMSKDKPFFGAILTLTNHSPFNLPPLPFERIKSGDAMENRYNAMKYADWALGEFFKAASKEKYFDNTLFVITGDHGIGTEWPITHMSLDKLHVPLLFYSPKLLKAHGVRRDTVASHVDIGPSVLALIGSDAPHQGWGRNLFSQALKDKGFAVIKHSGGDENVAIVEDNRIYIVAPKEKPVLYEYDTKHPPKSVVIPEGKETERRGKMAKELKAYVEEGLNALKERKIGVHHAKSHHATPAGAAGH
ncbi:MAG: LTA synthase family protein [Deltaproteobacteria bacterium]|nr:LTA synthase family protein [Deltaproteobacteria bacterium]